MLMDYCIALGVGGGIGALLGAGKVTAQVVESNQSYVHATLHAPKTHEYILEATRDDESRNWYIEVTDESGFHTYDGYWNNSANKTVAEVLVEAAHGSCLGEITPPAAAEAPADQLRAALAELLDAWMAEMPTSSIEAQDAWADRRAKARNDARALLELATPTDSAAITSETGNPATAEASSITAQSDSAVNAGAVPSDAMREALTLAREYVWNATQRMYDGTNGQDIRAEAKRRLALIDAALAPKADSTEPRALEKFNAHNQERIAAWEAAGEFKERALGALWEQEEEIKRLKAQIESPASAQVIAEQFPRSLPPTDATRVRELQKDAARWRMLVKILCYGLRGAGHGRKFKLVEVSQMYGDEEEVTSITTLIDAALAQQEGGSNG